jgi:hypothetical protein
MESQYIIFTVFQVETDEGSWWKGEFSKGKGNIKQLTDDGLEHKFEVHVQS